MHGLDWYDYGARNYEPVLSRFTTPDPLAEKYYSTSPYAYCAGNPVMFVDPGGRAWRPTSSEDHDGQLTFNGYEWIDDDESYDSKGNLLPGLYSQAIFFSDNGTFDSSKRYNIGSSTATVYLADGTTQSFDAMTNPSDPNIFATVPEGIYTARIGTHNGSKQSYTALKMRDLKSSLQRIELGAVNPAYSDGRTYAEGIDIHKAGSRNYTGTINDGRNGVSQGCLLIDTNDWSRFIGYFNNESQKPHVTSVTVSRSIISPVNVNRLPAFNFIMNGTRRNFFNSLKR